MMRKSWFQQRSDLFYVSIALIFIIVECSSSCLDFPNVRKSGSEPIKQFPPKTIVTSAPEHTKYFDNNQSIIIDKYGIEIRFDCWAPYPINIQFNGHLSNREISVTPVQRKSDDRLSVESYCYLINVTIVAQEEATGQYTCFSVEEPKLRTSKYIYHSYPAPEVLLNRNQTIHVPVRYNLNQTIIPCATSNPSIPVNLYKEYNGVFRKIEDSGIQYNPQKGFELSNDIVENIALPKN